MSCQKARQLYEEYILSQLEAEAEMRILHDSLPEGGEELCELRGTTSSDAGSDKIPSPIIMLRRV